VVAVVRVDDDAGTFDFGFETSDTVAEAAAVLS
jgi:hypothetical protein